MFSRRAAALAATALSGLGLLTGCQKPLPEVGAVADGRYALAPASLWCFDGNTSSGSCRQRAHAASTMTVHSGASFAVEVPQEVVDRGWYVRVVDRQGHVLAGPIQKHSSYFRLSADFGPATRMSVQVVALPRGEDAASAQPSGVWEFALVNADAG